ncbi:hypothetical protein B5S30_g5021 [[Candida] boidinii]|nr:hypothetical protein B5S30_g5021 [[Candida] boidinii]
MSKEAFNIPDGEYEIDMSSLFAPLQSSDVFGVRFGFKPDTIDEQFPSILLREKSSDNFVLQTESKENPKAIINNNSIHNNKTGINQILFDGKLQSNAFALNSTVANNNNSNTQQILNSDNLILLDENSDIPSLLSGKQQKSEFVLIYDNISNEFKMETFNGIIKMSKSREPNILNNKFNDLLNDYRKLDINEFDKLTDDVLSSNSELNNSSNNDNISPSRSTKQRRITTLVPPPNTPSFNGSASPSNNNNNSLQHIGSPTIGSPAATIQKMQRKANGAMKLTPSNATKSRVKIPVSRGSQSSKIYSAPTSVMSLKKAAMSSKNFGENKDISRVKQQSAISSSPSNRKSQSPSLKARSQSRSPAPTSIEIPSSANNSEFFSDEDLESFAEELEDELDTDKNSDTGYSDNDSKTSSSKKKSKISKAESNGEINNSNNKDKYNVIKQEPEVIELGKGSDEEWQVNLSDWEDDAFDFDDDPNNKPPVNGKPTTSINEDNNLALQATPQPMKENNHINSIQEVGDADIDEFDDEDFDIEFEDVEDEDKINDNNNNNDNDEFGLIVEDDPFASKRVNTSRSSTPNTSTDSNSAVAGPNATNKPTSIRQLAAASSNAKTNSKNSTPNFNSQVPTPRLDTPRYESSKPRLAAASPTSDSLPDRASRKPTTGRKSTTKSTAAVAAPTTADEDATVVKPKSRAGRPKGSKNKTKKADKAAAQNKVPETIEIADDFDEDELDKVMDDYDFDISDTEETDGKNNIANPITIDGDDDEEMSEEE